MYREYDRHLTNSLVLISCLARNLFITFPRLSEEFTVEMFDYEGNEAGEVRVKELLDLFVHHRYMNLHNEYVTDLVSDKPPAQNMAATESMGHKFRFLDFIARIREAVESVTIKDLATRLLAGVKSLNFDTTFQDVVFLVQNTRSFSDLIEATIPTRAYDFMRDILFPAAEIPKAALRAADGGDLEEVIHFRNPQVEIGERLDEKTVKISINGTFEYRSGERVVLRKDGESREGTGSRGFLPRGDSIPWGGDSAGPDPPHRATPQVRDRRMSDGCGRLFWFDNRILRQAPAGRCGASKFHQSGPARTEVRRSWNEERRPRCLWRPPRGWLPTSKSEAGMRREGLYNALSANAKPIFGTVARIVWRLGMQVRIL